MNIIFLDIDGVINMYGASSRTFMKDYGQHIEQHLVNRLNYICENVKDLRFVISLSWRHNMEDLEKQLKEQGFKYWNLVIDKTCNSLLNTDREPPYDLKEDYLYSFRGEQIKEWLDKNDAIKYLVIDDEISDICGKKCNLIPIENVCEINGNRGMLRKDAINIINYFKAD